MQLQVFSGLNDKIESHKIKLLGVLFFILFLLFVYLAYQSITLNYLPIYSDEYGYYLGAKAFQLCNRPDAAFTLNEYYSVIGNSSFYGFIYYVFYGAFFKLFSLFGITPSIMLVNIFLLVCFLLLMAFSRISLEKKLLIGIVFLSNFIFILYLSSSMTEIFHFIFGVIVGYLIYLLYKTRDNKYFYGLLALILLLSFFRPAWIFVLFGLFPLANSFRSLLKYVLVLLFGLLCVMLIEKYLYASNPFSFMYIFMSYLSDHSLVDSISFLYEHFASNVDNYFISVQYGQHRFVFYYKYLFVALLLYSVYSSYKTKERSIMAGTMVAIVFFLSVLFIYDAFGWREVRVLATPFILLVTILILEGKYIPILLIILFQLLNMNVVLEHKFEDDSSRYAMHSRIEKNQELLHHFLDFEKYIAPIKKNSILILMDRSLIPFNDSPILYQLPLVSNSKCIRYSTIYRDGLEIADSKCDLFISRKPYNMSDLKLVGKNKDFFFYRKITK